MRLITHAPTPPASQFMFSDLVDISLNLLTGMISGRSREEIASNMHDYVQLALSMTTVYLDALDELTELDPSQIPNEPQQEVAPVEDYWSDEDEMNQPPAFAPQRPAVAPVQMPSLTPTQPKPSRRSSGFGGNGRTRN